MKKSLIKNAVKFIQNSDDKNHSVHAQFTQCDYVPSTGNGCGGGAKI